MTRKKTLTRSKDPIKLRRKKLADGSWSLYLDCYYEGSRWTETLKIYLVPERAANDKLANKEREEIANRIRLQRIDLLYRNAYGITNHARRSKVNLIGYIESLAEKKRIKAGGGKKTTGANYLALAKQIEAYKGRKITFKQVDRAFCLGFIDHLRTVKHKLHKKDETKLLHENTQAEYITVFEAVINSAISDEIMTINPFKQIKPENKPKKRMSERVFLTPDEVKTLVETPFNDDMIRKAFLFACYTGLRSSDVRNLTWGKLQNDGNGEWVINYVQKKTKKQEHLPIPSKAFEFLPERDGASDKDKIFVLPVDGYVNNMLRSWAYMAGIKKHLTFHVGRHTYAVRVLNSTGGNLEVLGSLLAHANPQTTKIYAKIVDPTKRQAVNMLND